MSQDYLTPEITRVNYQKRHSLVTSNELLPKSLDKRTRPLSLNGLTRLRSKSQNETSTVSSLVFQVVLIGSKGVGKTSIIHRYLKNTYSDFNRPTVSDIYEKTIMRTDSDVMNTLKIYDTAGDLQYEFPAMFGLTVAEGDMFVFVYSVENRRSFEAVKAVWKNVLELKGKKTDELPYVIAANKADVSETRREVSQVEGIQLSKEMNCPLVEVSAKTGFQVDSIYKQLMEERETIWKYEKTSLETPSDRLLKEASISSKTRTSQNGPIRLSVEHERRGIKRSYISCVMM